MARTRLGILTGLWLALAGAAWAQPRTLPVDIPAGPLSEALLELARQSGAELLFDREVTRDLRATRVVGRLPPEAAVERLLQDTALTYRRAPSGVIVVERADAPLLARQDVAVPEVLVIGRRSQNADIRRLESDIQPYRVTTGLEMLAADRDNLDQYFGSRLPANTTAVRPSLDLKGETISELDLRGLGPGGTLVLVDGRRMPGIPAPIRGFRQPDLNALPLHAIERVEVLTGAAGGIHGFGALGGVANVVLRRGDDGAELHGAAGVSSRGDGGHASVQARLGFRSDDGRTELRLHAGRFEADPLRARDREYLASDFDLSVAQAPFELLSFKPTSNAVFLHGSSFTAPLQLKSQYGGGSIGAAYTFVSTGLSPTPAELGALLRQNAGQMDRSTSERKIDSHLSSTPQTAALLANLRHGFGEGFVAYLDAVILQNRGRYLGRHHYMTGTLDANSPHNPFTQLIQFSFPAPDYQLSRRLQFDSARYTAGIVASMPFGWRATADVAVGAARYRADQVERLVQPQFHGPTNPALNPFGDWAAFRTAVLATTQTVRSHQAIRNKFRDGAFRVAGPVFETPAGPATLTLLAEQRVEAVPGYLLVSADAFGQRDETIAPRKQTTTSVYAELRSRLLGGDAPVPLRGLEVQLAIRHDIERNVFATNPWAPATSPRMRSQFSGTAYTLGAKVTPAPWLMLRGSYATGETPPPLERLVQSVGSSRALFNDPQRGKISDFDRNMPWTFPPAYQVLCCGFADPKTVRVSTAGLGVLLTPFGDEGPRLAMDVSRIRKSRDVYIPTPDVVVTHEAVWPERVTRAPLTEVDRARGYTAGVITAVDVRPGNLAGLKIETVDTRFDWRLPWRDGRLRLYGDATYYIRQVQTAPFREDLDVVGYYGRPLSRRANAGAEWSVGDLTLGANVQYYGDYRIVPSGTASDTLAQMTAIQGSMRVPAQTYLDLHVAWRGRVRAAGGPRDVRVDLGLVNVFDKAPPRESRFALSTVYGTHAPYSPGYSRYGDARQRRVQLSLSAAL